MFGFQAWVTSATSKRSGVQVEAQVSKRCSVAEVTVACVPSQVLYQWLTYEAAECGPES